MNPILSIIVPHYNDIRIKNLFESLTRQIFKNFEVIVVDDKSDPEYTIHTVCKEYQDKGLNITLLESDTKIFSFNARYKGMQVAQGKFVVFWDSDDVVLGTDGLAHIIDKMVHTNVDILSFFVRFIDDDLMEKGICNYARPLSTTIVQDRAIIELFLKHKLLYNMALWGKIYKLSLLQKIMPIVANAGVLRASEDIFMSTIACFYAESYLGVTDIVYGFYRPPAENFQRKRALSALSVMVTIYKLIETVENLKLLDSYNQAIKDSFRGATYNLALLAANNFYYFHENQENFLMNDELFKELTYVYKDPVCYIKSMAWALISITHLLKEDQNMIKIQKKSRQSKLKKFIYLFKNTIHKIYIKLAC